MGIACVSTTAAGLARCYGRSNAIDTAAEAYDLLVEMSVLLDGIFDFFDVQAFLNAFSLSCP